MKLLIAFLLTTIAAAAASDWHFVPPPDSGVVSVKDYGAKGDGTTDDTAAILQAISSNINRNRYRANPFIYFPAGTYLVSDSLEGRIIAAGRDEGKVFSAGWCPMMIFIGEDRQRSVIRLKDGAPGFADAAKPKWLIATGSEHDNRNNQLGGGNRAFRHYILNLTIDVGAGNPGAIGIDFIANNRGAVEGVTLKAGEGSGHVAINLTRPWPGPAMIDDVSIEGFDHAFKLDHYQYGMTFENIRMTGQRKTAIVNTKNVVVMRKVSFSGSAPFYESSHPFNMLCLLDSSLEGKDGAAITTNGLLDLRRVSVKGFTTAVDDTGKTNADLPATGTIARHFQGTTFDTSGKPPEPLDLPIEEIPIARPPTGATWTDGGETSESLQAAIDGGAEWIYLKPVRTTKFSAPVVLRGKVRLIMGFHGNITGPDGGKPAFIVGDEGPPLVCLEQLCIAGRIDHPSSRTLALRHCDISGLGPETPAGDQGLNASGPGKTHVLDVIGRNYQIGPKHTLWARQLNAEFGAEHLFTNSGKSCIIGFKMETTPGGAQRAPLSTPALLNRGGDLEMIGGLLYTLGTEKKHAPQVPAFTNESGRVSLSYRVNGLPKTYYPIILRKGSFSGNDDVPAKDIKGPGAALLTDQR